MGWLADTAYGAAALHYKAVVEGGRLFVATTPGTSHASVEPNWAGVASGGTVADNTIVWTHVPFNVLQMVGGSLDTHAMRVTAGLISAPPKKSLVTLASGTSSITVTTEDTVVVDATDAAKTVILPNLGGIDRGREVTVKKSDTSANAVTITCTGGVEGGGSTSTIPGGSRGHKKFVWADGTGGMRQWLVIGAG